jgi:hypothetical protein
MSKILNAFQSIKLNYKTWLLLLGSNYLLSENFSIGMIQYILSIFLLYIGHVIAHMEIFYPMNYGHIYHHENVNPISTIMQVQIEVVSMIVLYVLIFFSFGNILDKHVALMFGIFYTTVHNINYSIFHVNKIHEKHHNDEMYNYGPDIMDILMGTKYDPENNLENTDHYIPNIILGTLIALYVKKTNLLENEKMREILLYITIGSILFLMCSTLYFAYKKDHKWIKSRSLEDIIMETTETKILNALDLLKVVLRMSHGFI